jgi:hypothetical protein
LYIEYLGYNAFLGSYVEEFARAVPAYVNSDLLPLPWAGPVYKHTRAHAGEIPTQRLLGLHTTPSIVWFGLLLGEAEEGRKRTILSRAVYLAIWSLQLQSNLTHDVSFPSVR